MKFYENSIVHNPKLELQNPETAKKVSSRSRILEID